MNAILAARIEPVMRAEQEKLAPRSKGIPMCSFWQSVAYVLG